VSLELRAGEVLGLMGHNGAGKSTLVKVITGAELPTSGRTTVAGQPIRLGSVADARRHGIVAVYQELRVIPTVTVAENVAYPHLPSRFGFVDRRRLFTQAENSLRMYGVDLDPRRLAGSLSQAEMQLVEVVAALSVGARVILLDEPTSSLGAREISQLEEVVRGAVAGGVAVVFITHKIQEVLDLADRVVVLRDGELVADGERAEFDHARLVRELTGAPDFTGQRETGILERVTDAPTDVALAVKDLEAPGVASATLTVESGEVVGLYGLLGSGRTALLRSLYGANPPSAGTVEVLGRPWWPKSPVEALKRGICLLTEDRKHDGVIGPMSVQDNQVVAALRKFRTGLGLFDRRRAKVTTDAERARLGILGAPESAISSLSGGNQQKVLFSRLHLSGAKVLLLDEPTRGVDVGAKRQIYDVIREEARSGKAVLVASSEVEEVLELCNRCYVVHDGRAGDVVLAGPDLTAERLRVATAN